ncbi:MAG: 16S rRNA (guanine527-N7)-methyltransferase [Halioglobus sp.]
MDTELEQRLLRGSEALGLELSDTQAQLLLDYLVLMQKWNRAYNLTAIRDPLQMVSRHLLDSLAISQFCNGSTVLDVGTGAGLPGVPLAILFPERHIHLLDSNGKKTRFLFQVKTALGLDNITVHNERVELFTPAQLFDSIFSRAFASLQDMAASCRQHLAAGGSFLAMKGVFPEQELKAVESMCRVEAVHPIEVPSLGEPRHLVAMTLR